MIIEVTPENQELLFEVTKLIDGPLKDEGGVRRRIARFAKREGRIAYIFVEDNVVLGYVGCESHENNTPPGSPPCPILNSLGHVARIGVVKDARGRKIGKRLLEAAESWIKAFGLPGVWLDYIPNDAREGLYKKYEILTEFHDPEKDVTRRIAMKRW